MSVSLELSQLRQEYTRHELDEKMVHSNPLNQFTIWFNEALDSQILEPNAFTLSTIDVNGYPTARVLLLKELTEKGFVFYTNYNSDKGKEIEKKPFASMTFLWLELQRQIRIKGAVTKIEREISKEYFQSRPFESQLGAWVSPQSTIIPSRAYLDEEFQKYQHKYNIGDSIPLPDHWGGYVLQPKEMEFWQGRSGRLHDRIRYKLDDRHEWIIERLAP
jgi:pyridoxamine 5'-phosphate oxidase